MNDSDKLHEQMWDLVYGLLTPDETEPLIARIKSDPRAARLYAEVRLQSDLVGFAAKVEDPSLVFQIEPQIGTSEQPTPARRPAAAGMGMGSRGGNWLVGIAATALAALLAVGFFWPQPNRQQLASNILATDVSGPQTMTEGISAKISVHSYLISYDRAAPAGEFAASDSREREKELAGQLADVKVRLVDAANEVRFFKLVRTSQDGRAEVELPGEAIAPNVRLEVAAALVNDEYRETAEGKSSEVLNPRGEAKTHQLAVTTPLAVEPEPLDSYFFLQSPVAKAGDEINFSTLNVKRFSGTAVAAEVAQISVDNAEGLTVAAPMWTVHPDGVVASGSLQLPANVPTDELSLTIRETNGSTSQASLGALVDNKKALAFRRSVTLAEGDNARRQDALGDLQKVRQKQKEQLVAGGGGQSGLPAPGSAPASGPSMKGPAPDQRYFQQTTPGPRPENLAQETQGLEKLRALKDSELQAVDEKKGIADGVVADSRLADRVLAARSFGFGMSLGEGKVPVTVVAAGQPVTMPIPADQADNHQLYAVANWRGVNVASAPVSTTTTTRMRAAEADRSNEAAEQSYAFTLPPEADGEMEVALVDRSKSPPEVVERRLVYREPSRKLNIQVAELTERIAPGEKVQVTLEVLDEEGRPAAGANLFVRLWNEQVVQQAAAPPVSLDDAVRGQRSDRYERSKFAAAKPQALGVDAAPMPTTPGNTSAPGRVSAPGVAASGGKAPEEERLPAELVKGKLTEDKKLEEQQQDGLLAASEMARLNRGAAVRYHDLPYAADFSAVGDGFVSDSYLIQAPAETVTLASTRPQAELQYSAALAAAQEQRRSIVRTLGGIALAGGAVLLVIVGALSLGRLPTRGKLLLPAVAVAAVSLVAGVIWLGRLPQARDQQVALAPPTNAILESRSAPAPAAKPMRSPAAEVATQPTATGSGSAPGGFYAIPLAGEFAPPAPPAATPFGAPADPSAAPQQPEIAALATTPSPPPAAAVTAGAAPPIAAATNAPTADQRPAGEVVRAAVPIAPTPLTAARAPAAPTAPPAAVSGPAAPTADDANAARRLAIRDGQPTQQDKQPAPQDKGYAFNKGGAESHLRKATDIDSPGAKSAAPGPLAQIVEKEGADKNTGENVVRETGAANAAVRGSMLPADGTSKRGKAAQPKGELATDQPNANKNLPAGGGLGGGEQGSSGPGGAGIAMRGRGGALPSNGRQGGAAGGMGRGPMGGGFGGGGGLGGFGSPGGFGSAVPRGIQSPPAEAPGGQAAGGQAAGQTEGFKSGSSPAAPTALYVNPQLVTDELGRVTFEFTMPEGETEYRLLVDALSKGRLGSKQQIIAGTEKAEAAKTAPATAKAAEAK